MIQKADLLPNVHIEYFLNNGKRFQYEYSPGNSVIKTIDEMTAAYGELSCSLPNEIWINSDVYRHLLGDNYAVVGPAGLRHENVHCFTGGHIYVTTIVNRVKIETKPNLRWPIFYGTEQEYNDNEFNDALRDYLT